MTCASGSHREHAPCILTSSHFNSTSVHGNPCEADVGQYTHAPDSLSWCFRRRSLKKSTQLSIQPLGWGVPPMVLSTENPNRPWAAFGSAGLAARKEG